MSEPNLTPKGHFARVYFFGLLFAYVVADEIEQRIRETRRLEARLAHLERPNLLRELARSRCTPRSERPRLAPLAAIPHRVDELPYDDEHQEQENIA